jgi:hypothetical protein
MAWLRAADLPGLNLVNCNSTRATARLDASAVSYAPPPANSTMGRGTLLVFARAFRAISRVARAVKRNNEAWAVNKLSADANNAHATTLVWKRCLCLREEGSEEETSAVSLNA